MKPRASTGPRARDKLTSLSLLARETALARRRGERIVRPRFDDRVQLRIDRIHSLEAGRHGIPGTELAVADAGGHIGGVQAP